MHSLAWECLGPHSKEQEEGLSQFPTLKRKGVVASLTEIAVLRGSA